MYLTGLVQRDRLFEVATRWFRDWLEPEDGRFATQVFIYESLISGPTARKFLADIIRVIYDEPFQLRRMTLKDQVREAILASCLAPTAEIRTHIEQYRALPEEFFPRTPVDLMLATGRNGELLGMTRIKRMRRVAEKASRRVADRLAGAIRQHARGLAQARARAAGIPLENLVTSPRQMELEFETAERLISQTFRDRQLIFKPLDLRIDDFIGFKFIGTPDEQDRLERAIRAHPRTTLVEREVHQGDYNATNLLVDLELPPAAEIVASMCERSWDFALGRGLDPEDLERGFPDYVHTGARTFRAEIILTTYDELVESEFGRSIHEVRILDQRSKDSYTGRIATNASYIIEYLLMVGLSPTVAIDSLPVKMWGRYLSETFSSAVWQLFGIQHGVVMWDSFMPREADVIREVSALWHPELRDGTTAG